jgi:hypothetical protein
MREVHRAWLSESLQQTARELIEQATAFSSDIEAWIA